MNATGTVNGLLHGVVREQAKDEWNLLGQVKLRNALGDTRAYIFKVGRTSTNDATQDDDSIHIETIGYDSGSKDQFKTAWHPFYNDV